MIVVAEQRKKCNFEKVEDTNEREKLLQWADNMAKGRPFLESGENGPYSYQNLYNTFVSRCFNCKDISIWIYDKLVYPRRGEAPPANPDLPDEIRRDYDEASSVLDLSPRGAAALIRLCIQKTLQGTRAIWRQHQRRHKGASCKWTRSARSEGARRSACDR